MSPCSLRWLRRGGGRRSRAGAVHGHSSGVQRILSPQHKSFAVMLVLNNNGGQTTRGPGRRVHEPLGVGPSPQLSPCRPAPGPYWALVISELTSS